MDGYHITGTLYQAGSAPTDVNGAGMGIWRINTGHTSMPPGFTGSYGTLIGFNNTDDTGFQLMVPNYNNNNIFFRTGNPPAFRWNR